MTTKTTHFYASTGCLISALDRSQIQRIAHVMDIGRAQLVKDIQTFRAEAERFAIMAVPGAGPTPEYTAFKAATENAMSRLADEFQRYVDEADELIAILGAIEYGPMSLALITDVDDQAEAEQLLAEIAAEQAEGISTREAGR